MDANVDPEREPDGKVQLRPHDSGVLSRYLEGGASRLLNARALTLRRLPVELAILASALLRMTGELGTPIHGNFYFRQAHVAANIELFLANGLSVVRGSSDQLSQRARSTWSRWRA